MPRLPCFFDIYFTERDPLVRLTRYIVDPIRSKWNTVLKCTRCIVELISRNMAHHLDPLRRQSHNRY